MADLNCIVVTPEQTALEQTCQLVVLPLFDGEIGIAPGHSPMIGRLGYGEMRIKSGGTTSTYYIDGGFVQVADNVVSVLTSRAIPSSQIDADLAKEQLAHAQSQPANSPELMEIRDRTVDQSRAMLRVARKSSK